MLQHTIRKEISVSGIGLHTGKNVNIRLKPAGADHGIVFIRTDLPGRPMTKANLNNMSSTVRGTNLGNISTIEHILSALYALSITNLYVEIDGPEPPALDGSTKQYIELIAKAGITDQASEVKCITVNEPVFIAEDGKCLIAVPSDRFTVSFMINYPLGFIGTQFYKFEFSSRKYVKDIAPARTYGFIDELEALKNQGLALGASEENAVAISRDGYLTKLRFKDEMVRHKILDLIGDLSLLGAEIKAHVIGIRSGHGLNIKFAKKLALRQDSA
jgi:UDP-3-O-[3-hydroxymyristoyl] N-acetylglucosamine deacetylase